MISLRNILVIFSTFSFFSLALGRHTVEIIAGEDADIKDFPYMVAIVIKKDETNHCAASILNENTLLTAGHCGITTENGAVVRYGKSILSEGTETNITQFIINENFDLFSTRANDIGIMKVDPPIVFSENVQPIKLAQKNAPNPEGKLANYAGWGLTARDGSQKATVLQKVNLTITNDKTCNEIYHSPPGVDLENNMCAQADVSDGKNRGICNGDSGSPLVIDGVQYGITSRGSDGCGSVKFPVIYTRVSYYQDWIADKL